jgi:hypothetical protein
MACCNWIQKSKNYHNHHRFTWSKLVSPNCRRSVSFQPCQNRVLRVFNSFWIESCFDPLAKHKLCPKPVGLQRQQQSPRELPAHWFAAASSAFLGVEIYQDPWGPCGVGARGFEILVRFFVSSSLALSLRGLVPWLHQFHLLPNVRRGMQWTCLSREIHFLCILDVHGSLALNRHVEGLQNKENHVVRVVFEKVVYESSRYSTQDSIYSRAGPFPNGGMSPYEWNFVTVESIPEMTCPIGVSHGCVPRDFEFP